MFISLTADMLPSLCAAHLTAEEFREVCRVATEHAETVAAIANRDVGTSPPMTPEETARWFLDLCRKARNARLS